MLDKLLVSDILYAATSTGAEFAEVFVESNKKNSLGLINGKLERALSGIDFGIGIRIINKDRMVYVYTNKKDRESLIQLIASSMEYANMVVYEKSRENKEYEGMGTTLEICLIYNNRVYIGHIGDSRVYRIRNKVMRKLTKDHSYVQQLLEDKKITREEAMHHPKKNMLTKALGCTSYIDPDLRARVINKNDIILMCSDGLTNMVSEEEIYQITKENPKEAANKLTMLANNHGGYDNITVLIIM